MATLRRLLELALAIALIAPSTVSSRAPSIGKDDDSAPSFRLFPKAFIIELEPRVSNLDGRSLKGESMHSRFHRRAQEEKLEYKIRQEFVDDSLFHGLSIDIRSAQDVTTIENLPEVKRVWPVVELPLPVPSDKSGSEGTITKRAPALPPKGPPKVIRSENSTMDFSLKATGVDQLHSHGFKGKGINVAVIDSGIDYNHPALGGGFGPGKKVAFGRNYVESEGTPDDPIATCEQASHGTSTAGIIIAEDPKGVGFGLKGVAPEATLGMYRVGSCSRGPESDTVLKALIDAYNDGANVVSVSIGWASGFDGFAPHDQVITNGKKRGIATVVAAGNDGAQNGPITMNMPAISRDAIAVACSDTVKFPTTYKVRGSTGEEWRYSSLWPLEGNFHVYAAEDYDESIGCDWGTQFAAIEEMENRGSKLFETVYMARKSDRCAVGKITTIMYNSGVAGVIWWQDEEAVNPSDNNYPNANSMGMDYIDGPQLYKAVLKDPLNFRLSFTDKRFVSVDNPSAGFTSNYSAYGSTWEYNSFKPLLSAPGHLTLTTYPMEGGGYDIASGTSIATPFVAGCYAIIKQAFPKLSVQEITDLLTTTATPAKWWGDDEILHTVSQQGAGTLNVWRAYNSGVKFLQGTLLVGQTSEPTLKNITFTNSMSDSQTFEISHVPAGLVQRVPYADLEFIRHAKFGFPSQPVYADVEFKTSTNVTLGPGESETVEFVVTPPEGIDPDTIPQYSGYIRFKSSSQDVYNVAYQGMPYDLKNTPILERDILPDYPQLPALYGPSEDSDEYDYFSGDMILMNKTNDESISIHYFRRQPVHAYRIDVVAANTTFEPNYFDFNASHTLNISTPKIRVYDSLGGVDSLGYIEMQSESVPRLDEVSWYGDLYYGEDEDGTEESGYAPEGDYRILIRVLRVEGDVKKAEDWESWLSPVVRLSGSVPDDDDDEEDDGDNEDDDDENDDDDGGDGGDGDGDENDDDGDEDNDDDGNGGNDGNEDNNGKPGHGGDDGGHDEYSTSSSSPSSPTSACL